MLKQYKTIRCEYKNEMEEKKSRFITHVKPVFSEEEAIEFINSLKSRYWDATHNCYGYITGIDNITARFSDDGEPSGTAGLPIYEVIKRMGLINVAVVVTRYFGGTLLGAAGLIRAYGSSASEALKGAGIIIKKLSILANVKIDYTLYGRFQNLFYESDYTTADTIFEEKVTIKLYVPIGEEEDFLKLVEEESNAKAEVSFTDKAYIALDEKGKFLWADG